MALGETIPQRTIRVPTVNFSFQGYVTGATITQATNTKGESVDVSGMSGDDLTNALNKGELSISLGDYLYENNRRAEIEIFDFDVPL